MTKLVDLHCHILPYVDDGALRSAESDALLEMLFRQGVRVLCATPHLRKGMFETPDEEIRIQFSELQERAAGRSCPMRLFLSREYHCDDLFRERLHAAEVLCLGEGNTLLIEFSSRHSYEKIRDWVSAVLEQGYRPLIAHPERYRYMEMRDYERLRKMGALMQLNLPSIIGAYGDTARLKAEELLSKGMYAMVGSDCHKERILHSWYSAPVLKKDILRRLEPLMKGEMSLS